MTTKTKKPLRGKALVAATMNQILKHPKTWRQSAWHCGSSHCFAGWAQILGGLPAMEAGIESAFEELVGLTEEESYQFWNISNSLRRLYALSEAFIADKPLDQVTEFKGRMVPLKVGKGKG